MSQSSLFFLSLVLVFLFNEWVVVEATPQDLFCSACNVTAARLLAEKAKTNTKHTLLKGSRLNDRNFYDTIPYANSEANLMRILSSACEGDFLEFGLREIREGDEEEERERQEKEREEREKIIREEEEKKKREEEEAKKEEKSETEKKEEDLQEEAKDEVKEEVKEEPKKEEEAKEEEAKEKEEKEEKEKKEKAKKERKLLRRYYVPVGGMSALEERQTRLGSDVSKELQSLCYHFVGLHDEEISSLIKKGVNDLRTALCVEIAGACKSVAELYPDSAGEEKPKHQSKDKEEI
eukprot:TRINITY_DN2670_c0_g1_i1.p1 TRINITY_DN2670_c0_g1~~TRINITY_DN2670_c0_g1_i1.p1  ORF type:complete len:293 (+),score=140.39 TRINITY_DN2670_c0_g1_i1:90-968(+)